MQVVPYFYPAWAYGGIPRVVYELSRELAKMGHNVTVYTTDVLDQDKRCDQSGLETKGDGITVRYFRNVSNALAYHYQLFMPRGMRKVVQKTIDGFDVIHLHGHRNFLNTMVHCYAKKAGKRYILSGHGTVMRIERRIIAKLIFDRIFGDRILKDAARCIAVSEYELRQYAEMGIKRETVDVIYNGIDTDAFHDLPEAGSFKIKHGLTGRKMVLYLGKITPRKGIDFLVKAFAMLGDPDAMLVIAGNDMGYRRRIEVVVREKGVGARVLFTGLLTGRDKLAAYVDADVLAYPAVHEIFGLVPFEAIMCGTPVIVTDDCGCGEIIGRENLGIVVKYGDVPGLTRALTQTLDDKAGAEARTRRAREFVMRALDWPLIAKKHIALYEKVLHK